MDELEEFRTEQGDNTIIMLAESEFGDDYYGMFDGDGTEVGL